MICMTCKQRREAIARFFSELFTRRADPQAPTRDETRREQALLSEYARTLREPQ